jgi:uncharacterized membrane protein
VIAARASFGAIAAAIALATALRATGPAALAAAVDLPFSRLCHRIPERVLTVAGVAMPLCSRCTGLWGGLSLAAAFAWPALSIRALRVALPVAALLMLAEIVTQDLGLHPVCHATRLLSGLLVAAPLGGTIGRFITRDLVGPRGA